MTDPNVIHTNGASEDALEFAPQRIVRTQTPPSGELGSAYDADRIFTRFDNGRYFETRDLWPRDFEDMLLQDGKARTLERVLTLPLMSSEWSVEPAPDDSGQAEFVREVLTKPANSGGMSTPLDLVIGQMTTAVTKKRAYFEKVYKADGGRVTFDKIAFRPQSTCYLMRDKKNYAFRGFKQKFLRDQDIKEVEIPPQRAFVYIHGSYRDPLYGTSALDTCFHLYESKQKVRFLWFNFLENQVLPKAIAKHNSPDTDAQREFAEKVAGLKSGGVVGIGPDQAVDVFSTSGSGGAEFRAAMDYLSAEQANSVLAGFTDLASAAASGRGSFALSSDQSDFFLMSLLADLGEMASAITSWLIADLITWNFGPGASTPTFRFSPPRPEAVEQAFGMLQTLVTAPVTPSVPREFIDLLTEKVSGYLGLNTDEVHKAIEEAQENAPQDASGQLSAGIDAATQLVQAAGLDGATQAEGAVAP